MHCIRYVEKYCTAGQDTDDNTVHAHRMLDNLFHFNDNLIFLTDIKKFSNIKFHTNPSSWCQFAPFGWTDMRKLVVAFRNFAKAFKKGRKMKRAETPEEEHIGTCLQIFQAIFDPFRFGSLSHVLVTSSYCSNTSGPLTVPVIQSLSTQFHTVAAVTLVCAE